MEMLGIEYKNRICSITVNRPPVNALDASVLEQLIDAVLRASAQSGRSMIISGVSGRFCSGLDTKKLMAASSDEKANTLSLLGTLLDAVAASPIPIAAAINGHCLGSGTVLAALCDYRVMENGEYRVGMPEVKLGLTLPPKVHRVIARLVGDDLAREMCDEGRLLNPQQAHTAGLVDKLVEPGGAGRDAGDWCERLLALPRETMLAKRAKGREALSWLRGN